MKKLAKLLVAVLTVAVMACSAFALVGCDDGKTTVDCSKGHADANSDGVCDNCKATIVTPVDCTSGHVDANNDGKCDNCKGAIVKAWVDAGACKHKDELPVAQGTEGQDGYVPAGDDKCDLCGMTMSTVNKGTCVGHIDLNNDGACDFCHAKFVIIDANWHNEITGVELSANEYKMTGTGKAVMLGGDECDATVNLTVKKTADSYTADLQVLWNVYGGAVKWAYMYTDTETVPEGYEVAPAILDGMSGSKLTCSSVTKNGDNVYTALFAYKYFGAADLTISVDFIVDSNGTATAYFVGIGGMDLSIMQMGFISVDRAITAPMTLTAPTQA